jgi:hypothetical protein
MCGKHPRTIKATGKKNANHAYCTVHAPAKWQLWAFAVELVNNWNPYWLKPFVVGLTQLLGD